MAKRDEDKISRKIEASKEASLIKAYKEALTNIKKEISNIGEAKTAAQKVTLKRLTELQFKVNNAISDLKDKSAGIIKDNMKEQYTLGAQYSAFEIEKNLKAELSFTLIPDAQVEKAILNNLGEVGFVTRNTRNTAKLIVEVNQILTAGLIQGKGYKDIAKQIDERFNVGASNAIRIARTEGHKSRELGTQSTYEHAETLGVLIQKQWVSALDDRTRDAHGEADGQIVDVDQPFIVDGEELMQPGDPSGSPGNVINCRCTTIAIVSLPDGTPTKGDNKSPTYTEWLTNKKGGD